MSYTLLPVGWKVGRLENVWDDMDRMMGLGIVSNVIAAPFAG